MSPTGQNSNEKTLTLQQSIDWVREHRNATMKRFLDRSFTEEYFSIKFSSTITDIKFRFLVKDVAEFLIAPVDLVHYASLLKELKEQGIDASLLKYGDLITEDIERVLKKYVSL